MGFAIAKFTATAITIVGGDASESNRKKITLDASPKPGFEQ